MMSRSSLSGVLLLLTAAQCLLHTPRLRSQSPSYSSHRPFRAPSKAQVPLPFSRTTLRTSTTRLSFSEFDSGTNSNGTTTELLEALLSHADPPQSAVDGKTRDRDYEAYQRRRLGEQLRLNKQSYQNQQDENVYNNHGQVLELFQRARLAEQLRFEKNVKEARVPPNLQEADSIDIESDQLKMQLEQLHQMVKMAISPSASAVAIVPSLSHLNTTGGLALVEDLGIKTTSLHKVLTNTHLPLAPREDASPLSLLLAPLAHLVTSLFLLGASTFHAIMAILDVLWNDETTKSCLNEEGHVLKSCWCHVSKSITTTQHRIPIFRRITEASNTCLSSFWYVAKCIVMRAKHSKYAYECTEAGKGSLRYAVYAIQSVNVAWRRAVDLLGRKAKQAKPIVLTWKRKAHLYRLTSSIKNSTAKRLYRNRCLQLEQRRMNLEQEFKEKLHSLNQDRIVFERDRRAVELAQCQVEEDRRKLLCESVNLLAWYSAVSAADSPVVMKDEKSKQRGWGMGGWWKVWD